MARLALLGGSYSPRSIIANCQRCINLYPELNPQNNSPVPITHYQRPGLLPLASGSALPVRGLYRASNNTGYCVIGLGVYSISSSWVLTHLGDLSVDSGKPCRFQDNGTQVLLVDGSQFGYIINLTSNSFNQIVDPTGTFNGGNTVGYIDTFLLWNLPGTIQFGSTLSNEIQFDPLYTAGKTDYPDLLAALIVNRHEILLVGQLTTEVWYDAGLATFPFAELPGAFYEHGTVAPYSVASSDISVFFLGQDLQGQGLVFRIKGYQCTVISNHAVATQIRKIADSVGISDAIGFTYQKDQHIFYVLQFPAGDQTWVFDDSLSGDLNAAWHQECWTDANGELHRHRSNCHAFLYGKNVVGDWENGTLYSLDMNTYTDTVAGVTSPLTCIRTFPHIGTGELAVGVPGMKTAVLADGKRVEFKSFSLDMECGMAEGPLDSNGNPLGPSVVLRWSDDRGRTYGSDVLQTTGEPGQYLTQPLWRGLGIARDRIFEIEYAANGPAALNGAWVDGTVLLS